MDDGLAHRADRGLELLRPDVGRNPPRGDVQLRHLPVVPLQEREEVAGEIPLVLGAEAAHDPEVDRDVVRRVARDEDVAGVQIGVEEVVAEDLGEEDLGPPLGELLQVEPRFAERLDVVHRDAVDAVEDQHVARGMGPVDERHLEQPGPKELAPQGRGGRSLAQHVELVEEDLLELGDDRDRMEPAHRGDETLGEPGDDPQQPHVAPDHLLEGRPHHLDHDPRPAREPGRVHLGDGGGGERRLAELLERLLDGRAERALHDRPGHRPRERRHVVAEERELRRDVVGNEVRAGGEGLPELDEDGPEGLEGAADPDRARRPPRVVVLPGEDSEDDEVETVSHRDARDAEQPQEPSHRISGMTSPENSPIFFITSHARLIAAAISGAFPVSPASESSLS